MATYYVRKTGSDSAPGDGSSANPWLTINKAYTTVSIAGGHTINVGDGTYEESGYFNCNRAFLATVTIQSESGIASSVIIQGSSNATYNTLIQLGASNLEFKNVTLANRIATSTQYAVRIATCSNITFTNCIFPVLAGTSLTYGAYISPSGAGNASATVTFTNCTVTQVGTTANAYGIYCTCLATNSVTGVTITNLVSSGLKQAAVICEAGTGYLISGGNITTLSNHAVRFGVDGLTGVACTGTIQNATITCGTGHALLLGAGVTAVTASGNYIVGGDYGVVVKENGGSTVTGNTIVAGTSGGLYFKAATGSTAQNNIVIAHQGAAIKANKGDTGNKFGTVNLTCNHVLVGGTGTAFSWLGDTDDSGGCVVDYNIYNVSAWGAVRGSSPTSLATLRTAWVGYGDGSNDSHSRLCDSAGMPFSRAFKQSYRGAFA